MKLLLWCAAGLLVALTRAPAATHYVDAASTNAVPPFTNWANAAAVIQDAVDAAAPGDEIVVTNGVYQTGARAVYGMSNRVAVTKPVTVRSVNGPAYTSIVGQGPNGDYAIRCVYLTNDAVLAGFTLASGATQDPADLSTTKAGGGGVWSEGVGATVSNCVLRGNTAYSGGGAFSGTLDHCSLIDNWAIIGGGASEAALKNCMLTGNVAADRFGGGAYASVLNTCTLTGNYGISGGGAAGSTLTNCVVSGNTADENGGGAYESTLYNCTFTENSANLQGGGTWACALNDCTLTGNTAYRGGGVYGSALTNCALTSNSVSSVNGGMYPRGGGAYESTLVKCLLRQNGAFEGGGACLSTLINCLLTENGAIAGGGTVYSTLTNCTLTGNSASGYEVGGGGAADSTLNNCIVYNNSASGDGDNYYGCSLNYSCTTPDPGSGVGNITNAPLFVDTNGWSDLRLQSHSPCINAGNNAYVTGNTDLEGHPRIAGGAVDIGAFEWQGTTRYVSAASTNAVPPFTNWNTAAVTIQDAVDASAPGDDIVVTNGIYQTGERDIYGMSNRVAVTKPVTVRSVNGPAYTSIVGYGPNGDNAIRCAYLTHGAVLSGFTLTNGATQTTGDTDYGYQSGGGVWCESVSAVLSNCMLSGNSAPYNGGGAYAGTLRNCTLTGNGAGFGGGAYAGVLSNCILSGNSAFSGGGVCSSTLLNCTLSGNSAFYGGGTSSDSDLSGVLYNCTLSGNTAYYGGGAASGTLNNCTLSGNAAYRGGGVWEGQLNNCVVYYNSSGDGDDNFYGDSFAFNYSCTTPDPASGVGNITDAPLFVDTNGWSNLRLQSNSPCINAGNNAYVTTATDLDGLPRIAGTTVDMGADEFQFPASTISYAWLQQSGLPTDGSADDVDTDHDGHNNWQEWIAGTDPTNALSMLCLASPMITPTNVTLTWTSVTNRTYTLEQATNLGGAPAFSVLHSNLVGLPGTTSWTDTNAPVSSPRFYQLRVSP